VDYCYNITLLDQNGSFVVEPSRSLALKCHFKIHLPFGNKIALKLRLQQDDANIPKTSRTIHLRAIDGERSKNFIHNSNDADEFMELENYSPITEMDAFPNYYETFDCDGIRVDLISRTNERWSECLLKSIETNVEFVLTLPDNLLMIRITKHITRRNGENPQLIFEYSAVPIEEIVSQCAFGWILIDQYCVSAFDELLSWQQAESHCNTLGGHLAAINNDIEQQAVDNLLINR
jgi:hypothetical protein